MTGMPSTGKLNSSSGLAPRELFGPVALGGMESLISESVGDGRWWRRSDKAEMGWEGEKSTQRITHTAAIQPSCCNEHKAGGAAAPSGHGRMWPVLHAVRGGMRGMAGGDWARRAKQPQLLVPVWRPPTCRLRIARTTPPAKRIVRRPPPRLASLLRKAWASRLDHRFVNPAITITPASTAPPISHHSRLAIRLSRLDSGRGHSGWWIFQPMYFSSGRDGRTQAFLHTRDGLASLGKDSAARGKRARDEPGPAFF
ncbi:hypothetical protein QBC39DRAFT_144636 [Podospora conica]|nr:hypothetical protein QBC39DRAFT_144636 [Schizothecium conicum]